MAANLATIGTVLAGRPWIDGTEQSEARRAVVLVDDTTSEYFLVWYPHLGTIGDHPAAVQGLLRSKVDTVKHYIDMPRTWVTNTYRAAKRANLAGTWRYPAAGYPLERAARQARQR